MGATSVTGVGHGSAEGASKGNDQTSLGVKNLIGPRVIYASKVTLSSNVATVQVPVISGSTSDYIVLATSVNASSANAVAVTAFTIATDTATLTSSNVYSPAGTVTTTTYDATISFKGVGASDVVNFAVVKTGAC
jgi:hypothetical protein